MKTLIAADAVAAAAAAFAAPAMAQTAVGPISGYANLGYAYAHEDPVNLSAIQGRLGARTTYFGVEGQGAFGIGDDTDAGVKVKLRSEYSGYAVGFLPLKDTGVELFARVGYGHSSIKATSGATSVTAGVDSLNYGAGAQYFFNHGPNGVRADYTRYDFRGAGNGNGDVFSISYVRKFGGQ
jgi:outer membrane immunogenic protein